MRFVMHVALLTYCKSNEGSPRRWFEDHVVGDQARQPAFTASLRWPAGEAFRELALNVTTQAPDHRLTYIIIRGWNNSAVPANVDGWMDDWVDRDIAEWLEPPSRDVETLREFVGSVSTLGGCLVVRDVERIPWVRAAARRAGRSMGRTLWGRDVVHIFHTVLPQTGSYGWHFDRSDNLLYGLEGSKRFRVAGRQPRSKVLLDVDIGRGDALFVPRKLYHNGVGYEGGSTLVSIALKPYSAPREHASRWWRRRRNHLVRAVFGRASRSRVEL